MRLPGVQARGGAARKLRWKRWMAGLGLLGSLPVVIAWAAGYDMAPIEAPDSREADCCWQRWIDARPIHATPRPRVGWSGRIRFWGGHRLLAQSERGQFSLAWVSPHEFSEASPERYWRWADFGAQQYSDPLEPTFWRYECTDLSTYDDLVNEVTFPAWSALLLLLAYPLVYVSQLRQRWSRRRRGLCPGCGYSMKGSPSGACPECGEATGGL